MSDKGRPADAQVVHEARMRRIEAQQKEAARMIDVLREHVRIIRLTVGLPPDPVNGL